MRLTQWRLNTLLMRGNASRRTYMTSPSQGDKRGSWLDFTQAQR